MNRALLIWLRDRAANAAAEGINLASEPALNALIDRMYSAILGYEDVNAVLAKSAELAGFGAASVVVIRDSGEQGKCVNSVGVDIADIEQAEKNMRSAAPWRICIVMDSHPANSVFAMS